MRGHRKSIAGLIAVLALVPAVATGAVRSGDADGDGRVRRADVDGLLQELFDGDGDLTGAVEGGSFSGAAGADANDDGLINAADVALMPILLVAPFWTPLAPLPQARQEVGVAALNDRIYVIGGLDGAARAVSTVEYYDPVADTWFEVAPLPEPLHHVAAAEADGRIYSIGGLGPPGFTPVDSLYEYDATGDAWVTRANLPAPRGAAAAAVVNGRVYVAGGLRGASVADFAVYDPRTDRWMELPAMPTARDHLGAAAINGVFYAVGGRTGRLFAVLEVYDPESRSWRTDLSAMPTARGGLAVAALRGRLFAIGGEGNAQDRFGIFPQTEAYDPDTDTWETLPDMGVPRHGIGAASLRGRIFVPAGATRAGFGASAANEALRP